MAQTQSNKQSQSVKVIVNNQNCSGTPPRARRKRRQPKKEESVVRGHDPAEDIPLPYSPSPQFAKGLSAYPVRPTIYAPTAQMIQPDYGLNQVPAYFDKQFTNQQATLEEIKRNMDDWAEQFASYFNPLVSSDVRGRDPAPAQPPSVQTPSNPKFTPPSSPNYSSVIWMDNPAYNLFSPSVTSNSSWITSKLTGEQIDILENDIELMKNLIQQRKEARNPNDKAVIAGEMRRMTQKYGYNSIHHFNRMLQTLQDKYDRINWDNDD